ncbi:MAG: class I SAM-dependent DNA methyltransferase, partial [bacterium]
MAKSTEELAHLEWLGYVQPVGLVVSIPALLEAQCHVNRNIMGLHGRFLECLPRDAKGELLPELRDLAALTERVLEWRASDLVPVPPRGDLPESMRNLEVVLPHYDETLRPSFAVPHPRPAQGQAPWQMLVTQLDGPQPLEEESAPDSGRHWNATPQAKFERLLRETGISVGLLCNSRALRLVYAPRGESSGYATFPIAEMTQVAGRPIFAALQMLLSQERLFALGDKERLPAILENSRKYQNLVSTALAEQVLAALYELMRGFQAANDATAGKLLASQLEENPNQVYAGLLTVLMRLVFVLYAEDRNLLSSDPVYSNHYSVTGLFDRLRSDAGRHPDTMDQRYGAWAQLLTLFRLIYEGGQHGAFQLPARKGYLFDPERYPFLEGRSGEERHGIPRISDGVVFRVLQDLLILDGERLSYRALDVEQIGSVYETVMGFNLETAAGQSIAIRPAKAHGAPTTINLDELLATEKSKRAKWFEDTSGQKATNTEKEKLKEAKNLEELLVALDKKIMKSVTPQVVPAGAIVLQPSDERRRSGSHYTPRSLTAPIVKTTLEPILQRLCDTAVELPAVYSPTPADRKRYTEGQIAERVRLSQRAIEYARRAREVGVPHPQQILDLKVCDPAMGSGAFLVETCRFLGDELIKSWYAHYKRTDLGEGESFPVIPPDEDEVLYARRLVAQRCLYGVDKNEMAVDLAKLSLWLVTLAKDHAFTFLDHSLRHGDSLVGLTRQQIIGFHWEPTQQRRLGDDLIQRKLDRATEERVKILNAREDVAYRDQEQRLALANEALEVIRLTGEACQSAFISAGQDKELGARCKQLCL